MSNDKKELGSRNPFAEMLEEIHEDNELRKETTNLDKQIDQLRRVIWTLEEDQVTVIEASADLDNQLNSIIETSWVVEWTLEDTRALLEKLQGMSFTVQLDDQSIEEVKGIHSAFFANEKKLIQEAQQDIEKTLSQHRAKIRRIKDEEGAWLSFRAWVWAIVLFIGFLAVAFGFGFFYAKSKFT
jgi:small-conductance mechanosensitive channel